MIHLLHLQTIPCLHKHHNIVLAMVCFQTTQIQRNYILKKYIVVQRLIVGNSHVLILICNYHNIFSSLNEYYSTQYLQKFAVTHNGIIARHSDVCWELHTAINTKSVKNQCLYLIMSVIHDSELVGFRPSMTIIVSVPWQILLVL